MMFGKKESIAIGDGDSDKIKWTDEKKQIPYAATSPDPLSKTMKVNQNLS